MSGFIIFVVLLILLAILAIIFYIFNKIEKFTTIDTPVLFPPKITKFMNIRSVILGINSRFNDLYVATAEQYEDPIVDDTIYAVYSSFRNTSTTYNHRGARTSFLNRINYTVADPSVAGLERLKLSPSNIATANDYIFIELPNQSRNYVLSYIKITFDISNPSNTAINSTTNIFNIGTVNLNSVNSLKSINIIPMTVTPIVNATNTVVTYTYTPTGINTLLYCNLIFNTISKIILPIYIISFEMYFTINNTIMTIDSSSGTFNILSGNPAEQINIALPIVTSVDNSSCGDSITKNVSDCSTIEQKYTQLLKLKIPWAIYDASKIDSTTQYLEDILGRTVRKAIISGSYTKKLDGVISYIEGTINTAISFPLGSCPRNQFTICAITKYASPTANRKRVLNGKYCIGHNNGIEGVITIDSHLLNKTPSKQTIKSNWVVTCFKLFGNNIEKTIIINNEKVGTVVDLDSYDDPCNQIVDPDLIPIEMKTLYNDISSSDNCDYTDRLYINNLSDKTYNSDFGLAYLMVWHTQLLDNEMLIVSQILNNYINNGIIDNTDQSGVPVPLISIDTIGSVNTKPAKSAIEIKTATGTNKNGFYWIQPDGAANPKKIFCIMDSKCEGGGWMLAMKASQGSTLFDYMSKYWIENTELVPAVDKDFEINSDGTSSIYMDTTQDAKYDIYNTFQAIDCLAIFDSREFGIRASDADLYTDPSNKQYGWRWVIKNFNDTPITLLNYFKKSSINAVTGEQILNRKYIYTCKNAANKDTLIRYINTDRGVTGGTYVEYNDFMTYTIGTTRSASAGIPPYNNLIWSYQAEYLSYGLNVYVKGWNNRVRWGGVFNDNTTSIPDSCDDSGGIGLETSQDTKTYCAGDYIGYMSGTTSRGVNKSLSFKWFIR